MKNNEACKYTGIRRAAIVIPVVGLICGCGDVDEVPRSDGGSDPASGTATVAQPLTVSSNVRHISQRSYAGIGESACAPTSVTMLLRYYFPASRVDVPEVFHAGTQAYRFDGPLAAYQNVSNQPPDTGINAVPTTYRQYFTPNSNASLYTGAVADALVSYLQNTWGLTARYIGTNDETALYNALQTGPVLVQVWAHGNTAWGHWMLAIGVDDAGTATHSDDTIITHDPYGNWNSAWDTSNGISRRIAHRDFFTAGRYGARWFRGLIITTPPSNANTTVADNGSPYVWSSLNTPQWREYYGSRGSPTVYGDWVFPTGTTSAWYAWPAVVPAAGWYDITAVVQGDATSGNVTYSVQRWNGSAYEWRNVARTVNQYRASPGWVRVRIGRANLAVGDQVFAYVPPNTNVDAVRFESAPAPTCPHRCADYRYHTSQCLGSSPSWTCFEDGCIGTTGATCGACQHTCAAYGYAEGQCWQGWKCNNGCLANYNGC